jgi:hypothetical protein
VDYVVEVLTSCQHNGFPVVRCGSLYRHAEEFDERGEGASVSGPLQGIILRSQLLVMLRHQVPPRMPGMPSLFVARLAAPTFYWRRSAIQKSVSCCSGTACARACLCTVRMPGHLLNLLTMLSREMPWWSSLGRCSLAGVLRREGCTSADHPGGGGVCAQPVFGLQDARIFPPQHVFSQVSTSNLWHCLWCRLGLSRLACMLPWTHCTEALKAPVLWQAQLSIRAGCSGPCEGAAERKGRATLAQHTSPQQHCNSFFSRGFVIYQ